MSAPVNALLVALRGLLHEPPTPEGWTRLVVTLMEADVPALALDYTCQGLEAARARWSPVAAWLPGPWFEVVKATQAPPAARLLAALGLPAVPSCWIPPGTFLMGSPASDRSSFGDERQHEVTLTRAFMMASAPVTLGAWRAFHAAHTPGGWRANPNTHPGDDHPVEAVSWHEAAVFCNTLSLLDNLPVFFTNGRGAPYAWADAVAQDEPTLAGLDCTGWRLPTEAEWEYACRAGTTEVRYGKLSQIAWHRGNAQERLQPVGQKLPNPWGLHDTLGHVQEWCLDGYQGYVSGPQEDPLMAPMEGQNRCWRGGSVHLDGRYCRAANRGAFMPGSHMPGVGFRPARTCPLPTLESRP